MYPTAHHSSPKLDTFHGFTTLRNIEIIPTVRNHTQYGYSTDTFLKRLFNVISHATSGSLTSLNSAELKFGIASS
jgi:hypothetical protein